MLFKLTTFAVILVLSSILAIGAPDLPSKAVGYPLAFIFNLLCIYLLGLHKRKFDLFDPYHAISLLHLLYASAAALFVVNTGAIPYGDVVSLATLKLFVLACCVSQMGLVVGDVFGRRIRPATSFPFPVLPASATLIPLVAVLLLVLQHDAINIFDTVSYGDRVLDYNVQKRQSNTSGLVDFFNIFCQTALIVLLLKIVSEFKTRYLLRAIAGFLLLLILAKYLIAGDRANLVMAVMAVAANINYLRKRISLKIAGTLAVGGYVGFNLLSIARVSANPLEMIGLVADYVGDAGISALSLDKSGELVAGTNLVKLVAELQHEGYQYGANLVNSVLAFIPRFVMDRSSFFGNEAFVMNYYPETYMIGGGHGYFMPMDGYWDFGLAGAFVYSLAYAFFCTHVYRSFIQRKAEATLITFYSIFFSQGILFCMRSGIFASIKQYGIYMAGPVVIALLCIGFAWLSKGQQSLRSHKALPAP